MRNISTTRAELLVHKEQIALARQGRDLLEQKRTVLLREFRRVVDTVLHDSEMLQQTAAQAAIALGRAEAMAGTEQVRSAAMASRSDLPLQVSTVNVMGVKIPHIEQRVVSRSLLDRGYAVTGMSVAVDEAAAAFEAEVEAILQLSESELRLARLSREIQRTSRRLNALEHHLLPRLEAELKQIQMALDERERSDHFRMKLIKRIMLQNADEERP